MARLLEPIDLSKLAEEGTEFRVDADFVRDNVKSDEEGEVSNSEQGIQQCNTECIGIFDEDVYEEGEPFEIIGKKMTSLVPNGKIKKRVIREGAGDKPTEYSMVKIHFNAYVEYDENPFDSTYMRNKPYGFIVNDGRVIAGLDFAVQSMKPNEKSQFLIHPDYAYGRNCSLGRVPSNATVLFEVELLEIVHSGAVLTYEKLPEDQQKEFSEIYKYCVALCERGKKSFSDRQYLKALIDYNTCAAKLEKVTLHYKDDIEKHRQLLLKVYTNLLICYTRNKEFRKACLNAKKIYDVTKNGELIKIHPKVYFNHAKCLRYLGEYDSAKTFLDKAHKMEPKNPEIANEMLNLDNDRAEHRQQEAIFAKALMRESHES
ncbi:hypothetical protein Zmor_006750 [Zophobas morio]|uniref:peptidylprolyl isomerase n=1 Tax=Zophobas morio TaxID=2755281 RepID=A0AA38I1I8_9CUCU|nr:hypothetical protein Zmor_019792 [Zophobas morio]KAJ3662399.1 hypothetical protein Zmor_006750 [Zophobas morio]